MFVFCRWEEGGVGSWCPCLMTGWGKREGQEGGVKGSCGTEISAQQGERKMEGEGGRERRKPSVKKQVGVMKEDNKSFLSGHVGQDLTHQSSWPVTTIGMTTQTVCVYI